MKRLSACVKISMLARECPCMHRNFTSCSEIPLPARIYPYLHGNIPDCISNIPARKAIALRARKYPYLHGNIPAYTAACMEISMPARKYTWKEYLNDKNSHAQLNIPLLEVMDENIPACTEIILPAQKYPCLLENIHVSKENPFLHGNIPACMEIAMPAPKYPWLHGNIPACTEISLPARKYPCLHGNITACTEISMHATIYATCTKKCSFMQEILPAWTQSFLAGMNIMLYFL